ncbi:sensor domain-containing diguanylate cyclase [Litchfieldia alkalitelluris]|uniref:sensor domain-containing diguanylate cyclase n=1 Tax=Litchfieldia alkalitelluris TaxID=304268 RepID=UPI0009964BCE|nr:sensor domain-containing diguanylate cyclase [Litchfieldia alkalitelluris]
MRLLRLKYILFLSILGLIIDFYAYEVIESLKLMNNGLVEKFIDQGVIVTVVILLIIALINENKLQGKLTEKEEQYRKVVELSPNGIVIHKFGIIKYVNPVGVKILGAPNTEELIGKDFLEFIPSYDHENIKKAWHTIHKDKKIIGFINVKWSRLDNQTIDVEVMGMPVTINGERLIQQFFRDITEQKKAQEQIYHMAHHDALTGLPNRSLFEQKLSEALKSVKKNKTKLAVLFLDLDGFKKVNDTLGHDIGDLLLKEVTKRLETCVRVNDILSRFAGDEFTILLPEANDEEHVVKVAERILESLDSSFIINDNEINVTTSIGISINSNSVVTAKDLVKLADLAMYVAKQKGKNTYHLYDRATTLPPSH